MTIIFFETGSYIQKFCDLCSGNMETGKVKKFNITDVSCSYEDFMCDIQCRSPALRNRTLEIEYLDDEDVWVVLFSDACVVEAFRCAKPILGSKMRRVKTRVVEDTRVPQDRPQETKNDQINPNQICNSPKSTPPPNLNTKKSPIYRSPLQLMIDELEDSINVKKVEHVSAKDYLKILEQKFSNPGIKQDKTKGQCSQCHLRLGHNKRHCDYGPCEGPQMCGDLDKHDNEKKEFTEATQNVKAINRELEKLKQNLSTKKTNFRRKLFFIF